MSLAWQDEALSMLTDPDATRRALWRCALQLNLALAAPAGRESADLLLNLALQPDETVLDPATADAVRQAQERNTA
jgi:hypothetical protein